MSRTVFNASELESTMRLQRRTPKLPIRSLTPFPHSGNLDDAPKTLHVLKPFSAVTCGIAMLAGVDREFLKSDTIGPSGGVLSGLRVLERMIQNNPSNLMRVIPTKGARRHCRFSFGPSRSLLSESFSDCNLKGRNEFSKTASVEKLRQCQSTW